MINPSENICGLKPEDFQTVVNGKKTDLYILRNANGCEVAVTNYGGSIAAMMMPDKDGKMGDVIHGFDNIQDMLKGHQPFLSTLVGRYGNRIKEGRYTLNGKEYQLAQ